MTDAQLTTYWIIGVVIALVTVAIAAVLLWMVLSAARETHRTAAAALGIVRQIRENTQCIWALQDTNRTAAQLLGGAQSILGHAGQVAQALHDADARRASS
ncbi:MAG: hypothetical protein U0768_04225 [Anaerolineae bacterium]